MISLRGLGLGSSHTIRLLGCPSVQQPETHQRRAGREQQNSFQDHIDNEDLPVQLSVRWRTKDNETEHQHSELGAVFHA